MSTEMQGRHQIQSINTMNLNGDKYDDLIKANPYRNIEYTKTPWQNFLSSLGIRTQADAWKENMQVQANEYDAGIAQMKFQNEYNSPLQEASRMRESGLNPDLQGIGDVAESAGMGEDPSTPMQTTGDEAQIQGFVSGVISCFSTALGMVSTVQGIHRNALENSLLAFKGSTEVTDIGERLAPTFLSPVSEGSDFDVQDFLDDAYNRAQLFSKKHFPKKYRNNFNDSVLRFLESAPGEAKAYETWYNDVTKQKEYFSSSNTFYSPSPKTMKRLYSILGSVEERIFNLSKSAESSDLVADVAENESREKKADYDIALYSALNPAAEASARNAEAGARKNQAEVTNILRGAVNDILSALKDDDSEFSGLFGFLLRIYSMYMFTK